MIFRQVLVRLELAPSSSVVIDLSFQKSYNHQIAAKALNEARKMGTPHPWQIIVAIAILLAQISIASQTIAASAPLGHIGAWKLQSEVELGGRLAYIATLEDRKNAKNKIEIRCWPAVKDFTARILSPEIEGPQAKPGTIVSGRKTFIQYTRDGYIDQAEAHVFEPGQIGIRHIIGDIISPMNKVQMFISIDNIKMQFNPDGGNAAFIWLIDRCKVQ